MKMKLFAGLAIALFALLLSSCEKDPLTIPYQNVDFQFSIYQDVLDSPGGIKIFGGQGYNGNGVIVCHQLTTSTDPVLTAFDATCPKEHGLDVSVKIDESGILKVKCPVCNTAYDLRMRGEGVGAKLAQYGVYAVSTDKIYYRVKN